MSTEQSEGETPTAPAVATNSQADITQQATTPTTRVKKPKRIAAGKRVAERTLIAREQQKKAEASVIIANNNAKAAALITTKHIDFDSPKAEEIQQQSSPAVEQLQTNSE